MAVGTMLAPAALLLAMACSARTVSDDTGDWKTGPWSECRALLDCGEGWKHRHVQCAAGARCADELRPDQAKPCFTACRHHREKLQWRTGSWSSCASVQSAAPQDHGVMQRNVSCVLLSQDQLKLVDDENCLRLLRKPDSVRGCALPHSQDCVVGRFTPWSSCAGCATAARSRTRTVLVAPRHNGKPCPELSERQACHPPTECLGLDRKRPTEPLYSLKIGAWQPCEALDNAVVESTSSDASASAESADSLLTQRPGVGAQGRNITCRDRVGRHVDISMCAPVGVSTRRVCVLPRDCAVGAWSPWTPTEGAQGVTQERTRAVLRLAEGEGRACPHTREARDTQDEPLQKHHGETRYRWTSSGCRIPGQGAGHTCGGGIDVRDFICVDSASSTPVAMEACLREKGVPAQTVTACEVACVRDCVVGSWQPWSQCRPLHCPNTTTESGYMRRSRRIVVAPSDGGVACPHLEEGLECQDPRCYWWRVDEWGACFHGSQQCGGGVRKRAVTCVSWENMSVPDRHCKDRPPIEEPCWVPCPYDCVVSHWSSWSSCSHACATTHSAPMRHRNRTVLAIQGPGGVPCPAADEMLQLQSCNAHSCDAHSWITLPWQLCERGEQLRDVWCVRNSDQRVSDDRCGTLSKPTARRACVPETYVECVASPWSAWSACADECVPDASSEVREGEITPTQHRSRVIVTPPSSLAPPCPSLEEFRPCPLSAARCNYYQWAAEQWGGCELPGRHCGQGFRTRAIWCYRNRRTAKVSPAHCADVTRPAGWQRCHVDCATRCALADWSAWSPCERACATSVRTREVMGGSCAGVTLTETRPCPCGEYTLEAASAWSPCVLDDSDVCGAGTRSRLMICREKNGTIAQDSMCGAGALSREPCMVACPVDCAVSEWTTWGECSASTGPGTRTRVRQVLIPPHDGGRPCGPLVQTGPCRAPQQALWVAQAWGECRLIAAHAAQGCGTGDQYRSVRCEVDGRAEDDVQCDAAAQPPDVAACHVACPLDCVLSEFSDWSDCDETCTGERQRTRTALRAPAQGGAPCPPLVEAETCARNVNCWTHAWRVSAWSSCLPLGGSACGEGVRTRSKYCARSDNTTVDDSLCTSSYDEPLEQWCHVECPIDCELTAWSAWNATGCTCAESGGVETRSRRVWTPPSATGRPCPAPLEQSRPCSPGDCYSVDTGPWGPCQLEGGAWCGHGTRERLVSCAGRAGVRVENSRCGDLLRRTAVREPCYQPCEEDCHVTEWSAWSSCHRDCAKQGSGHEARSRAVLRMPAAPHGEACPAQLWESRPCFSGPCLTFTWVEADEGEWQCLRSDGEIVVGGCGVKPQPCADCFDEGANTLPSTPLVDDEIQSLLYFPREESGRVWALVLPSVAVALVVFIAVIVAVMFYMDRGGATSENCAAVKA